MTAYKWSKIADNNGSIDSTINYMEGQAPSLLNKSARAAMAAIAKMRDDICGATVTDGTSNGTAYVLYSAQVFDTLAHLSGKMIAFTPSVTNTGALTLNVDTLGAKPLRCSPGIAVPSGTLLAGTPYTAVYNNTDGCFYLYGFYQYPGLAPLGAVLDFADDTLPSSSWAWANGQAISRSTYAGLFSLIGGTHGTGDGSTTFNLPDYRGRVSFAPDNLGGYTDASRLTFDTTINAYRLTLGGSGGADNAGLVASQIPNLVSYVTANFTAAGSTTGSGIVNAQALVGLEDQAGGNPWNVINSWVSSATASVSGNVTVSASTTGTGGTNPTHNNMPPCILMNKIIRVL